MQPDFLHTTSKSKLSIVCANSPERHDNIGGPAPDENDYNDEGHAQGARAGPLYVAHVAAPQHHPTLEAAAAVALF